jgi:predicted Zn-dependent peptidase
VVVRGGSGADDRPRGIPHVLEHLVFKGSTRFPVAFSAQQALEEVGGVSNATTTRDSTRYQAAVAADQLELALNVLGDVTLNPLLTDDALKGEMQTINLELQRDLDNPLTFAMAQAYYFAYRTHPYRYDPAGDHHDVLGLTIDDVRAFHRRWYVPNNMSVVLVGDITPAAALTLVGRYFGAPAARPLPAWPKAEPPRTGDPTEMHAKTERADTILAMAYTAPSAGDMNVLAAADVLVTMLGDGPESALSSWWAKDGLRVSGFGCEFISTRGDGRMIVWAQADPAVAGKLRTSTRNLLFATAKGALPEGLLAGAKRRVGRQYILENETYSAQAATLAFYDGLGDARMACRYLDAVNAATMDQVRAVTPLDCVDVISLGMTPVE